MEKKRKRKTVDDIIGLKFAYACFPHGLYSNFLLGNLHGFFDAGDINCIGEINVLFLINAY